MEIRTSTVAVVAASCITVGAAGAFLARRPSPSDPPRAGPRGTAAPPAVPAAAVATGGVDQSEGIIIDAPSVPAPAAAPASPAALAPAVAPPPQAPVERPRPPPAPRRRAPARVQNTPPATQPARPAIADSRPIATPPTTLETAVIQPKPVQ